MGYDLMLRGYMYPEGGREEDAIMCVAIHMSHNSHAGCDPLWCETREHRGLERLVFWANETSKA